MNLMHFSHGLVSRSIAVKYDNDDDDVFRFHPISCNEVGKVVQSFPFIKAPGSDKVSMGVIKRLPTLTEIVNCSLQSSVFPTC